MNTLNGWYRQYRARGLKATRALYLARIHYTAQLETEATLNALSPAFTSVRN